jgi:putative membrane protein
MTIDIPIGVLPLSICSGIAIGMIAGLLPDVHVNNTSAILPVSPAPAAAGVSPPYIAAAIVAGPDGPGFGSPANKA